MQDYPTSSFPRKRAPCTFLLIKRGEIEMSVCHHWQY
jgi:hypothetical protein